MLDYYIGLILNFSIESNKAQQHKSCLAQRKRAGLITRRTSDRNREQLGVESVLFEQIFLCGRASGNGSSLGVGWPTSFA